MWIGKTVRIRRVVEAAPGVAAAAWQWLHMGGRSSVVER
jgi:hypothetical protein